MSHPSAQPFGLFISCVQGCAVMRFGTRTLIGCERDHANQKRLVYDTSAIIALTHLEYQRYRREYNRALGNGTLTKRTEADWVAQNSPKPAAPTLAPPPPPPTPLPPPPAEVATKPTRRKRSKGAT